MSLKSCCNTSINLVAGSGSITTIYSGNSTLLSSRVVTGNNNDLTFNMGTGQFIINGPLILSSENAAAGDATPSVASTSILRLINTSGVTVSGFDGGHDDQILTVFVNSNTTIKHTSGVVELDNGINYAPSNGGTLTFWNYSGVWKEISRATY